MSNDVVTDDLFEQFAKEKQKEAEERSQRPGSGGGAKYVEIKWTGLEKNKPKIVRVVGGPPDSDVDEFTARTVRVSWMTSDDKSKFRCILPHPQDDPNHLIWEIISRVKKAEWKDGSKVFPVQEKHPDIWNLIEKNGKNKDEPSYIFDKGWKGQSVILMNVIDREQMDWHRENKKTMLLSKQIGVGTDGTEFTEIGVPSYGFVNILGTLFKFYKSWERYDIGITRMGLKETPYRIINASKNIEETEGLSEFVSLNDSLTEEEASWERYDLKKLFPITSYTKIYNKLKGKIALVDAALNTRYLDELLLLVEKEKTERALLEAEKEEEEISKPVEINSPPAETPVRRREAKEPVKDGKSLSDFLPHYKDLSEEEKALIVGVVEGSNPVEIEFVKDLTTPILECPSCGVGSPESFTRCPYCDLSFV